MIFVHHQSAPTGGRGEQMEELRGRPGELLDRLVELLNSDALGERGWSNVSRLATFFLGGMLSSVVPDTGPPVPGSVGEAMQGLYEVVSRETYFELIRERLGELVSSGLEEEFLARSVRDAIRQRLESLADTGKADSNREKSRRYLEKLVEDPAGLEEGRRIIAASDPSAETLSDDQIVQELHELAGMFLPTSPDEAVDKWALLTNWNEQATSLLSDVILDEWRVRRTAPS